MRYVYGFALLALLSWGLEQVAVSPLETGDVYPPYSSLRSDPLGSRALYESLADLPGIEVERLYKERTSLQPKETMFVLGIDPFGFADVKAPELEEFEKMVASGGRLVLAFRAVHAPESQKGADKPAMTERWRVEMKYRLTALRRQSGMPRETSLYFDAGSVWRAIGSHGAIGRDFGRGSIVLVADSFPLSNEGLRDARDAPFIAALAGPANRIVFDENHFGVAETGSVTTLMRKYHLDAAVAVLALAAGLFLWRSASSFLPPRLVRESEAVAGQDGIDGMTALLVRGVPQKNLLDACFNEWSKSCPRDARVMLVEDRIRGNRDAVEAYRAACAALAQKNK